MRARENLGRRGPIGGGRSRKLVRAGEQPDRLPRLAPSEGDVAEPLEGIGPREVVSGCLQRFLIQASRELVLVQSQSNFGIDEQRVPVDGAGSPCTGREVVLGDPQALPHLTQELQRRNTVSRLNPRDVRWRAARKRKIALAQPRAKASFAETTPDFLRVIDVRGLLSRHEGRLVYTAARSPGPGLSDSNDTER